MNSPTADSRWDAFISYASEDRIIAAQPLADALTALGLRIWFDQFELNVGDSLRERIDDGLARSTFGIVILSPAFFQKHYPNRELSGLAQREVNGEQVILPVWYRVTDSDVRQFSPPLADRVAAKWEDGLETVLAKLFAVVGKRVIEETREAVEKIKQLMELSSGADLIRVLDGVHAHKITHDDFQTKEEVDIVGSFLDGLGDTVDGLQFVGAGERARLGFEYGQEIENLGAAGWKVFVTTVTESMPDGVPGDWQVALVAVMRSSRTHVAYLEGQFLAADGKPQNQPV
jgi:hypothetical protein